MLAGTPRLYMSSSWPAHEAMLLIATPPGDCLLDHCLCGDEQLCLCTNGPCGMSVMRRMREQHDASQSSSISFQPGARVWLPQQRVAGSMRFTAVEHLWRLVRLRSCNV